MLKKILLFLVVFIVLSLQFLQRWINELVTIIEDPQYLHLWREITQGRNSVILFYLVAMFLGVMSKIFIVEVHKKSLENKNSFLF